MQPPRDDRGNSVEVALVAAARSLSSRLDVPGVADAMLAAVDHVFGASSSWVLLHDDREGLLKTIAHRGDDADAFRDVEMPANGGIMGLAFSSRQVVFVTDAQADDRWFDAARVHRTGLRSAFAVPLVCQDRALGVVGLDTPRFNASEPPGRADVARLEALAGQAAVGIRNAELFEASERDRRRMAARLDERRGLRRRVATLREEVRAASALQLVGAGEIWQETVQLATSLRLATQLCCCWARPEPARNCWRGASTIAADAPMAIRGRLSSADLRRLERACGSALEHEEIPLEIRIRDAVAVDDTARLFLNRLLKRGAVLT